MANPQSATVVAGATIDLPWKPCNGVSNPSAVEADANQGIEEPECHGRNHKHVDPPSRGRSRYFGSLRRVQLARRSRARVSALA